MRTLALFATVACIFVGSSHASSVRAQLGMDMILHVCTPTWTNGTSQNWSTSQGKWSGTNCGTGTTLLAGTYEGGITATGTRGQTCVLGSFNGSGSGGAATVTLTATNLVPVGAALTITAAGSGYGTLPTSATASNGTATCSGTATVVMNVPSGDTLILGNHTLVADQSLTCGNYPQPAYSYVSSLAVVDSTDTTCTTQYATAVMHCSGYPHCSDPYGWSTTANPNLSVVGVIATANGTVVTSAQQAVITNTNGLGRMWLDPSIPSPTLSNTDVSGHCGGASYSAVVTAGSWSNAVLDMNGSSNVTINSGVTFTVAGWGSFSGTGGTVKQLGNSTINIDNSLATPNATDGTQPIYVLFAPGAEVQGVATGILDTSNCLSSSPCYVNGNPYGSNINNSLMNLFGGWNGNGDLTGMTVGTANGSACGAGCFVNWSNLGGNVPPSPSVTATIPYLDRAYGYGGNGAEKVYNFQTATGSTCTGCGPIVGQVVTATASLNYQMTHISSVTWDNIYFGGSTAPTTGSRIIQNSVFDSKVNSSDGGSGSPGTLAYFTFQNNWFTQTCWYCYAQYWNYNIVDGTTTGGSWYPYTTGTGTYPITENGMYFYCRYGCWNWHANFDLNATGLVATRLIYDAVEDQTQDTSPHLGNSAPSSLTSFTDTYSIELPSKQGHNNGWYFLGGLTPLNANFNIFLYHHTFWGRNMASSTLAESAGPMALDHTTTSNTPMTMKSSLVVGLGSPYVAFKLQSLCGGTLQTNPCSGSSCDYNALYQGNATTTACASIASQGGVQGNGYAAKYSSSGNIPGAHDIDVLNGGPGSAAANAATNPMFVDSNRNLVLWDTKYLNTAANSAWASGTAYSVNTVVSDSQPNNYCPNSAQTCATGATINYRVLTGGITSGNNTAVTEPGLTVTPSNYITGCVWSNSSPTLTLTTSVNHSLTSGMKVVITNTPTSDTIPLKTVTYISATQFSVQLSLTPGSSGSTCTGAGANISYEEWMNWYEYNSEYSIQTAISAGTTYTDGAINCVACGVVQALNNWIHKGFEVLNPHLWGAGHDGCNIGADAICGSNIRIPPTMVVQ